MSVDEFTITYWVRKKDNPEWTDLDSTIDFKPTHLPNNILVATRKNIKEYIIYLLHPEFGNLKITTNIEKFVKDDLFVAITRKKETFKLYLNAKPVSTFKVSDIKNEENSVGDFVLVTIDKDDLDNFKIDAGHNTVVPAKIENVFGNYYTFFFWNLNQRAVFDKDKIFTK
uniref:Uncharacterized protein n=1 Tax=Candidatus Methanogaster sp. ANME-2c ERB4 TaxID=2759911 RepID=A0A7G9Y6U4_9EURY|nr:hypothetical protein EIBGMOBM_00001 [Methanosarcinales archaeon ANME-2c ERB4]QNO43889.1 hypothetical protein HNHCPBFK_00019 [Methanosarcinales archaeon ANME-2c ERB4]